MGDASNWLLREVRLELVVDFASHALPGFDVDRRAGAELFLQGVEGNRSHATRVLTEGVHHEGLRERAIA